MEVFSLEDEDYNELFITQTSRDYSNFVQNDRNEESMDLDVSDRQVPSTSNEESNVGIVLFILIYQTPRMILWIYFMGEQMSKLIVNTLKFGL